MPIAQAGKLTGLARRRIGILGAFSYSGANFFLAIVLQTAVPAHDFGLYAFALVCLQFGISISNALFAAPIVVATLHARHARPLLLGSYFHANLLFCLAGAAVLGAILTGLGMAGALVALVLVQAVILWMRWFFRAIELAEKRFTAAALADVGYGAITLLTGAVLFRFGGISLFAALSAMAAGTILSALVIGRDTLGAVIGARGVTLRPYLEDFRAHGRWALGGVVTTEVMANLHSYVLTLTLGPAAFAPVAVLALFFRPIPILMQAITQYERPVLAQVVRDGDAGRLRRDVRAIALLLVGAVAGNTLVVAGLIGAFPDLIGKGQYAPALLWPLMGLLALAQLVRSLRTGESAALQGAGRYRPLAIVTFLSAPVTLAGTAAALAAGWQVVPMVLVSVLAGEIVTWGLIRRLFGRLAEEVAIR